MPNKPKRPCSHSGCARLTNERFCADHQKLDRKHYNKYLRNTKLRKQYGNKWRKVRKRYVEEHPLCEMCEQQGKITPAEEVHHIVPISQGGTHDQENLMSLCKSCHSGVTANDGGRWGSKDNEYAYR